MKGQVAFIQSVVLGIQTASVSNHSLKCPRRHFCVAPTRFAPRAQVDQDPQLDSTRVPEKDALNSEKGAVVITPSYNLAALFMFTGGLWFYLGGGWIVAGFPVLLIGILLSVQSLRIRFVFGPTKFNLARRKGEKLEFVVGWEYDKITNWEFWWKGLPFLTYFKETESYEGRGSIHFFPVLCNGRQLLEQLKERTPHLDKPGY